MSTLSLHAHKIFVLELLQMMRQGAGRDVQLGSDLAYEHPVGMSGEQ